MHLGLPLDVVVAEHVIIVQLLALEDQVLLVGRDAPLVLDLGLQVGGGGVRRDIQGDRLARDGLHEDLHVLARVAGLINYNIKQIIIIVRNIYNIKLVSDNKNLLGLVLLVDGAPFVLDVLLCLLFLANLGFGGIGVVERIDEVGEFPRALISYNIANSYNIDNNY